MPGRMNTEPVESSRKPSNIERVMASTADETLIEWKRKGAAESNRVQAVKKSVNTKLQTMLEQEDVPQLLQTMLMGELPADERDLVRSFVPSCIPDESISPMVAMFYSSVNKVVTNGDTAGMEKLMKMAGCTADMAIKLSITEEPLNLNDIRSLSTAQLRELCGRPVIDLEPAEDDGNAI